MSFRLVTSEEKIKIAPELANNTNFALLFDGEKFWIKKPRNTSGDERMREVLGYLLGNKFANVAEVKIPTEEEAQEISNVLNAPDINIDNLSLIRVCGSYNLEDLPKQTLESAVASELIFSLWIRRRDTHIDNRVYTSAGIPVFYDHHVAFLGEDHQSRDVNNFFADKPDHFHGAASSWRVVMTDKPLSTLDLRNVTDWHKKAYHYVHDMSLFKDELEKAKEALLALYSHEDIRNLVKESHLENAHPNIAEFLIENLGTLENDVEKMKEVIFIPT